MAKKNAITEKNSSPSGIDRIQSSEDDPSDGRASSEDDDNERASSANDDDDRAQS